MSLFRRERLYASVELERVALVRLGADGVTREEAVLTVLLDPEHPQEWLEVVGTTLAAPAWRGIERSVVLSDRLVRYMVMERPEGVRSSAELRSACEARFQASFDRPAAEWEVVLDARPFESRFLACGVSRRLLDAIRTLFAAQGTLASLRPFLVCELTRVGPRLPADCWFVVVARDCVTLAGIARNDFRHIRVLAAVEPSLSMIQDALEREVLLTGELGSDAPVLLAGALQVDLSTSAMQRMDAPSWGAHPTHWSSGFRLALSERWV